MANFLDSDSVKLAVGTVKSLTKEAEEAAEAQKRHIQTSKDLLEDQIDLEEELAKHSAATNQQSSVILNEMQGKLRRVEEIEASPFLQIIEPVAGFFGNDFSREKLLDDVGTDRARLNIKAAEDNLKIQDVSHKIKAIDLKKQKADLELLGEQTDVTALANVIVAQGQELDTKRKFANLILTIGNDEQIQSALENELITEEEVKRAKETRRSKDVVAASNEMTFAAQKRQDRDAQISELDDDGLQKAIENGAIPARVGKEEQGRRINYDTAVFQQQAAFLLSTKSQEELDAIVAGDTVPGVTKQSVKKEGQKRTAASQKQQSDEAVLTQQKAQADTAQQNAENRIVANMTRTDLLDLKAQLVAQDGAGEITVKDRDGKPITLSMITVDKVSNRLKVLTAELFEDAQVAAVEKAATVGIESSINELATMLNINVPEDANIATILAEINKLGEFSSDHQVALESGLAKLEMARDNFRDDVTARVQAMAQANDEIQKARDAIIQEELSKHHKGIQPALKEYYRKGRITQQQDAINILAIENQEKTGVPAYDAALQIAHSFIANIDEDSKQIDDATRLTRLFDDKDQTTTDKLASILSTTGPGAVSEVHTAMAVPILATVIPEVWAQAAEQMQLTDVAGAIRAGTMGRAANGEFQELTAMTQLEEQKVDMAAFIAHVRERSSKVATNLFEGQASNNKHIMAAVNKVLADNNLDGFTEHWVDDGILQANLGKEAEKLRQQPFSKFPIDTVFGP